MGYAFDDGPNCSHNAFYDFLESQNQKATLFYIGSNVADWPYEAQRGIADGHEICVRECSLLISLLSTSGLIVILCGVVDTWSHRYSEILRRLALMDELHFY